MRDSVRIRYFDFNSLIDSWFRFFVSLQTSKKIRDKAREIAAITKQAKTADNYETFSPYLNLISQKLIRQDISNGENYERRKLRD